MTLVPVMRIPLTVSALAITTIVAFDYSQIAKLRHYVKFVYYLQRE